VPEENSLQHRLERNRTSKNQDLEHLDSAVLRLK